jgi:hypothetical protein
MCAYGTFRNNFPLVVGYGQTGKERLAHPRQREMDVEREGVQELTRQTLQEHHFHQPQQGPDHNETSIFELPSKTAVLVRSTFAKDRG